MENFSSVIISVLQSPLLLLAIEVIAFALKLYIGSKLIVLKPTNQATNRAWFLILLIIFSALLSDMAWIFKLTREIFTFSFSSEFYRLFLRIAWGFTVVLHQALVFFVFHLVEKRVKITHWRVFGLVSSSLIFFPYLIYSFLFFNAPLGLYDFFIQNIIYAHAFIVLVPSIVFVLYRLQDIQLPKILKKQALLFVYFFIAPYLFAELLSLEFFSFSLNYHMGSYCLISFSTFLVTYSMYICTQRMLQLRFLNAKKNVQTNRKINFIDEFSYVLEQLSAAENVSELGPQAQLFFKNAFGIAPEMVQFVDRESLKTKSEEIDERQLIEEFIIKHVDQKSKIGSLMRSTRILIKDELEFSNFYNEDSAATEFLLFLNKIKVDVFIPLYDKKSIVGCIFIKENARPHHFFDSVERDEMLLFVSYVSNTLNLLKQHNIHELYKANKELKDHVYTKHKEIEQYRESIRSLLLNKQDKGIGVIFYKNRRFSYANKTAREIIQINLNLHEGHSLTQSCKKLIESVLNYNTTQSVKESDAQGRRIILNGFPSSERGSVLIIVHYPDVIDIILPFAHRLKDPSDWDYLLYLETTASGQLICDLLPGSGDEILAARIQLLKATLTRRAALVSGNEKDLLPLVELIHTVSLRKKLHVIRLTEPEKNLEISITLFGINKLFLADKIDRDGLLVHMSSGGTIFIDNIHFLQKETQNILAYYLQYGFFKRHLSDEKIASDVSFIVSTNQCLNDLVEKDVFSQNLADILLKNHIIVPSLEHLSHPELHDLTHEYSEHIMQKSPGKILFKLTDKEKNKIIQERPLTIHELKEKVKQLLVKKTQKHGIIDDIYFDATSYTNDAEIGPLIKLGKRALKNPEAMKFLWDKFKNQNKIALLLGVNRSSVNRRCKDYNLL